MILLCLMLPWLTWCACIGLLWANSVRRHRQWQAGERASEQAAQRQATLCALDGITWLWRDKGEL